MNITDAAYQTVHDYPGGSESLGPRIGMSAAVLRNKVNPNNTTHHLTIAEADLIVGVTGDTRILQAFAANHSRVLQGIAEPHSSRPVLDLMLGTIAKEGQFAQAVQDALADGVISENEMRKISSAGFCMQEAVLVLLAKLREMAQERRP